MWLSVVKLAWAAESPLTMLSLQTILVDIEAPVILSEPCCYLTVQIDNTLIVVIAGYECKTNDNTTVTVVLVYICLSCLSKIDICDSLQQRALISHKLNVEYTNSWVGHPRAKM